MLSAGQKRLLAVVVGVVVAAATMAAFTLWLHGLIERRGHEEVDRSALRAIQLAEQRIEHALATLDDLARQGIDGCHPGQRDAIRHAAFFSPAIKEIAIIDAAGRALCSSDGIAPGPRAVLTSERITGAGDLVIEVLHVAERQIMVQVQRRKAGAVGAAALIPGALFGVPVSQDATTPGTHVLITARDGTTIVEQGLRPVSSEHPDPFVATRRSERFGMVATIALPRAALNAEAERLRGQATAFAAAILVAFFALAVFIPRRRSHDPLGEFEQAIAANEFVPYYQPVVDIRSGRLRGAEVLVRWRKADGSLVFPSAFIPLAESSGLIVPLTRALMRRVCDEIGAMIACRPDLKISFNLAAPHFADDRIVAEVRDIFGPSCLPLRQVVLEVTERQPLENLAAARRIIAGLQELGCGVAIDDVGTGHGGLSYILKLGADTIKIDKLFIDSIDSEHHSTTILETLVDLARSMRMDVVAEGVENFEQVLKLRDLGILAAQGHVFSPPLPTSSFMQLVEAIAPVQRAGAETIGDDGIMAAFDRAAAA